MKINTGRSSPPTASAGAMKSTPMANNSVALLNLARAQRAAPSQAMIAEKAYAIWLSLGKVLGHDQEHWFEAERQLRQA